MDAYKFVIYGYLFGREIWRKEVFFDTEDRGRVYILWYLEHKVAGIAADSYRVEMTVDDQTEILVGGESPNTKPYRDDHRETLRGRFHEYNDVYQSRNRAGWKEKMGIERSHSKHMRVAYDRKGA